MRRRTPDECPRCGAPLPSATAGVGIRTCGYCHTTVEVAAEPTERTPARNWSPPQAVVLSMAATGLTVAVGVGIAVHSTTPSSQASTPTTSLAATPVSAVTPAVTTSDSPPAAPACEPLRARSGLLVVEQDDRDDYFLLVVEAPEHSGERRLSARAAANGHELWTRPLDPGTPAEALLAVPLDETLVVAAPATLWGLAPGDGRTLWQRTLEQAPVRACAHGSAFGLLGAQGQFTAYSLATGSPVKLRLAECAPAYTSRSDAPNFEFVDGAAAAAWLPRGDGFEVTRGLRPRRGSAEVVLGHEKTTAGPAPASVGVLTGAHFLWQANVANEAPADARLTAPPLAAVRGERVVVPYVAAGGVSVTALELTTGERRWTTLLPGSNTASSNQATKGDANELAISRAGYVAYRAAAGALWVTNLETGALAWRLGCDE